MTEPAVPPAPAVTPAQAARAWYWYRRQMGQCVRCATPVTADHARCPACRAMGAAAQGRYRIRQILREGTPC